MAIPKEESICLEVFSNFAQKLFESYSRHISDSPFPGIIERHGLALEFLASFIPEAITSNLINQIKEFVSGLKKQPNYNSAYWWKALPLEAALFSVTRGNVWLRYLGANFAHHNSSLRNYVQLTAAPIMHHTDFTFIASAYNEIETSLINGYGGAEDGVILFAASNTPNGIKKEKLDQWMKLKDVAPQSRVFLNSIGEKQYQGNPFSAYLLESSFYIMLEIAASKRGKSQQLDFVDIPTVTGMRGIIENNMANLPKIPEQLIFSGLPGAMEKGDQEGKEADGLTVEQVMKRKEACALTHPFIKIFPD